MSPRAKSSGGVCLVWGFAVLWLSFGSAPAFAQACCAGASALTPGRLALHEDALVGVSVRYNEVLGSFDPGRRFVRASSGANERALEEDLFATHRFLENGQATLLVPFIQTYRRAPRLSDFGGGVGDINLSGRYDLLGAGESALFPGVAVLLGVTFPTGTPPEKADRPLATDATGIGAFQLSGGLALEQTYGRILLNLTAIASQRTRRHVNGLREQLGLQWLGLAAVGYTFRNDAVLALSAQYTYEGDASIDGSRVPGSGRALTTVGISGGLPLGERWRLQGGLYVGLPVNHLGRNQTAGPSALITLLRTWT